MDDQEGREGCGYFCELHGNLDELWGQSKIIISKIWDDDLKFF